MRSVLLLLFYGCDQTVGSINLFPANASSSCVALVSFHRSLLLLCVQISQFSCWKQAKKEMKNNKERRIRGNQCVWSWPPPPSASTNLHVFEERTQQQIITICFYVYCIDEAMRIEWIFNIQIFNRSMRIPAMLMFYRFVGYNCVFIFYVSVCVVFRIFFFSNFISTSMHFTTHRKI